MNSKTIAKSTSTQQEKIQEMGGLVSKSSDKTTDGKKLLAASEKKTRRKRKLGSRVNMWIRRIHLYSGLFMLPWVLLYGFTALLFNHPTYMTDSKTEIKNFTLDEDSLRSLPAASSLAELVVQKAQNQFADDKNNQTIEIINPESAVFTRQVFGSVENDNSSASVIMDLNSGSGYVRKRTKEAEDSEETGEAKTASIEKGLNLSIDDDPVQSFKTSVGDLPSLDNFDTSKLSLRSFPAVEFDALVNGERKRLRFSQQQRNRRGGMAASPAGDPTKDKLAVKPKYNGTLTIVGSNPREISARSFLLRLHMAHGYPVQMNSRWFWAIAVDLMFASMCFWGLSGVIMWWQIKRTRRFGFILLVLSAVTATWLAIGMHWQLVNG